MTIADLLAGHAQVQMPPEHQTFKQPGRVAGQASHEQSPLFAPATDQEDEDDADDEGDEA